ncbi:MAG: hypothetical protein GY797_30065 [Deltaproteobacteria bacterium]|nr:hypothetical protein [Deltaproteobacteria bacterium]
MVDLKVVTPIITFIAGFLLSQVENFVERRNKKKNLKYILYTEIKDNYRTLNRIVTPIGDCPPKYFEIVPNICDSLSTDTFDTFFSRIDILKPELVEKLVDTTKSTKELLKNCSQLGHQSNVKSSNEMDIVAAKATVVVALVASVFKKTEGLLKEFATSHSFIKSVENERGEAFDKFNEIIEMLQRENS